MFGDLTSASQPLRFRNEGAVGRSLGLRPTTKPLDCRYSVETSHRGQATYLT